MNFSNIHIVREALLLLNDVVWGCTMIGTKELLTNSKDFAISSEETEKLKEIELDILLDIVSLCQKKGIHYFLAYGTLLGAVRHKGFIPWDDDIDVAIPSEEVNSFVLSMKEEYQGRYFLEGLGFGQYQDPFNGVKVMKKGTIAVEASTSGFPYTRGIDVDVFPITSVPKGKIIRWFLGKKAFFLSKVCYLVAEFKYKPVCLLKNSNPKIRKQYRFRRFLGFLFSFLTLNQWIRIHRHFLLRPSKYNYRAFYPVGYFSKPFKLPLDSGTTVEFEKKQMNGFPDNNQVLVESYGQSYMVLPPVGKRLIHTYYELEFFSKDRI